MKNFYLATDAYDFNSPRNEFLAIFQDDVIKNIHHADNVTIENIDNFVGGGESFEYNLYIVEPKPDFIPFYYYMQNASDNQPPKLTITFGKNTDKTYIENVMSTITKELFTYAKSTTITHKISDKELFYTTTQQVNTVLLTSNHSLLLQEDLNLSYPQTPKDFSYLLSITKELKENSDEEKLQNIINIEERIKNEMKLSTAPRAKVIQTYTTEQLAHEINEDEIPF